MIELIMAGLIMLAFGIGWVVGHNQGYTKGFDDGIDTQEDYFYGWGSNAKKGK